MTCETAVELISAKLDGELTADEMTRLDRHLAQCSTCRALLEELTALHAACGGLEVEPPPALREQILQNLPAQDTPPAETRGRVVPIHWRRWTAMAASFALVALAAWHLPQLTSRPPESVSPSPLVQSAGVANDSSSAEESVIFTSEDITAAPILATTTSGEADTATAVDPETSDAVPETAKASPAALLPDEVKGEAVNVNAAQPAYGGNNGDASPAEVLDVEQNRSGSLKLAGYSSTFRGLLSAAAKDAAVTTDQGLSTEETPSAGVTARIAEMALPTQKVLFDEADLDDRLLTADPDGTIPEPHPELAEDENVPVTLFVQTVMTPTYCGVLTLQGGAVLNGYPAQVQENGETQYELPCSAFFALLEELTDSETDFTLRMTGTDVSSAAENGLVVILP